MRIWLLVMATMGFVGTGCGRDTGKSPATGDPKATEPYVTVNKERIKKDMEIYRAKAEARLKELDGELTELNAKAAKAGVDVKAQLDEEIRGLSKKRDVAVERLREIGTATAERWEEVRPKVDAALDDVAEGFRKAWSRFK